MSLIFKVGLGIVKRLILPNLQTRLEAMIVKPTFWFDLCWKILDYYKEKLGLTDKAVRKYALRIARVIQSRIVEAQNSEETKEENELVKRIVEVIKLHWR